MGAGDVIRIIDGQAGTFEIVSRGGNLPIKIFHAEPVDGVLDWLTPRLAALGGWIDGRVKRSAVFTVPVDAGFAPIEDVMAAAAHTFPGLTRYYGNAYDKNGQQLKWWEHK